MTSDTPEGASRGEVTDEAIQPDEVIPPGPSQQLARQVWISEGLLLLPNMVKLVGRLLLDPRVPTLSKAFMLTMVGYVLSPLDVFPDIIPFFGQLDDLLFVSLGLHYLFRSVGPSIVLEHWDGSENLLEIVSTVADLGASLVPRPIRRVIERLLVV